MMDNDFGINLAEVAALIREADVLVVRFPLVDQRLLLDARTGDGDAARLLLAPRVRSLDERFRQLRQMRPDAPLPDTIRFIPWPKRVRSFRDAGLWDVLMERLETAGVDQPRSHYRELLDGLLLLEEAEIRNAITGEGYRTIWPRQA